MYKYVHKLFCFIKDCFQFIKILILFIMLLFLLYWVQNLLGSTWSWLEFISPFFDYILDFAQGISSGSTMIINAVFEVKYLICLIIFWVFYFLLNYIIAFLDKFEEGIDDTRSYIKKTQENILNNNLYTEQKNEQNKINKYQIYISTRIKQKYQSRNYKVNLNEQNQLMNEFLNKKLGIVPEKYLSGFLFTLDKFYQVDMVFDVLNKLINSKAPLDYQICIQSIDSDNKTQEENLHKIINLEIYNKILGLANTVYRYDFNLIKRYKTTNIGIYQYKEETFELYEFLLEEKNI